MLNYLQELNDEQIKPVLDTEGQVLVFAGAGSGKTRVLTSRVSYLIQEKQIPACKILAITFTNKAAKEMQERISKITECEGLWVSTIHSMCAKILRYDIDKLGYTNKFTIFTDEEKNRLIKNIIKDMEISDDKLPKQAANLISEAKNKNVSGNDFHNVFSYHDNSDVISEIYKKYTAELKRINCLDFDDLLCVTFELFTEKHDVLKKYQNKFQYVHVDEFQDTNNIQFCIIKMLAEKCGNLFVVGDDDQSIYGWRGADVRNILDFQNIFPNVKIYKLQKNYRSTKSIIAAANKVIKYNHNRVDKELYTENCEGENVAYYGGLDESAEAYYVVKKIRDLINSNNYTLSDFGILLRVNALTRSFEQEFLKYNIPYKIYGGFKFFERKEIKDVLAYLRLIANPYDEDAILRVINVPRRGIGDAAIAGLKEYSLSSNIGLLDCILNIENSSLSAAIKNKVAHFKNTVLDLLGNLKNKNPSEFIKYIIMSTGMFSLYGEESEENYSKKLNLEELVSSCSEFEKINQGSTIIDYLQSVTLSSDLDSEDSTECVTISTIHAAKGLEFPVVFIGGLDQNYFPISRALDMQSALEEERRLMYVAITRAKKLLFLTRAESRYIYGRREYTVKSQFLNELGVVPKSNIAQISYPSVDKVSNNASNTSADVSKCVIGTNIRHKAFGEGVIISVNGSGNTTMIDVAFKGIGIKTLVASIAPIEYI